MRTISSKAIEKAVIGLCVKANLVLRPDVRSALAGALKKEKNQRARRILKAIIDNAEIAADKRLAICQDTGLPCVFLELGQDVHIKGDINKAVIRGVELGYRKGYLRNSVIADPLKRATPKLYPPVIHTDIVKGDHLKITIIPKGFGCENKSRLKMFLPTARLAEIKQFIIQTVKDAGPDACPPYVVGVGIGGTADYAMFLAKKALLRKLTAKRYTLNPKFESELLRGINKLKIGPMGLGGKTTCLGVNIETYPTHIAGLPVAVNISCHALRSASCVI